MKKEPVKFKFQKGDILVLSKKGCKVFANSTYGYTKNSQFKVTGCHPPHGFPANNTYSLMCITGIGSTFLDEQFLERDRSYLIGLI